MSDNASAARRRELLLERLVGIGPLRQDEIEIPGIGRRIRVTRPADFDRLLEAAARDPEQNLPYWAEIWPSGLALAAAIHANSSLVTSGPIVELGCGLGITAAAALQHGANLLVTDYSPEALALCAINALEAVGSEPKTAYCNWRNPASITSLIRDGRFATLLAADVLYEMRDLEPMLEAAERLVAENGTLVLAEPRRVPAIVFVETLLARGWNQALESFCGPWPDPEDNRKGVIVDVHRLRRGQHPPMEPRV